MSDSRAARAEWLALAGVTLLAALVRGAFVAAQGVPRFDPWRHLLLIRNVREGAGFTLYGGQPYIWYAPFWHELAALFPERVAPDALAAVFSTLVTPLVYLVARRFGSSSWAGALAAASVWAVAGPVVAFTCHYGSEALAVFALFLGLWLASLDRRAATALCAGLAVGLALTLRMNLLFAALLLAPLLVTRVRFLACAAGVTLPLAWLWWRNHAALAAAPFVFTWDGLAVRSADFDALSTLLVQSQPDVGEALRSLHQQIIPRFEWLAGRVTVPIASLAFMGAGFAALLWSRNPWLLASGVATAAYLGFGDRTLSSHWFRVWLGMFPLFCLAAGALAERAVAAGARLPRLAAGVLIALLAFAGAGWLAPAKDISLEGVTPPPELLHEPSYFVTSAFYPESLAWRFPDKRFLGLPLHAKDFADFAAAFPETHAVLWKSIGVQDELVQYLAGPGGFAVAEQGQNARGVRWVVLKRR